MNKIVHIIFTLLLAAVTSAAAGEMGPKYQLAGIVDGVDFKSRAIVIDDIRYQLGPNLLIHGRNGRSVGYTELRPGVKVGLTSPHAASLGQQQRVIHEIWLLPDKFDLGHVPGIHFRPTPESR